MKITELPIGSRVIVRSSMGIDFLDFETEIMMSSREENAVYLQPIKEENRPLDFSSGRIVNTVSVVSEDDDKAYVYRDLTIEYVQDEKNEDLRFHRICSKEDVEPVNRRKYFRMYLGEDGVMQVGPHRYPIDVVVKDISVSGIAVVCSADAVLDLGSRARITFTDNEVGQDFHIRGSVVRKNEVDPTTIVLGCKFPYESDAIGKYIAMKQRMHRRNSMV